MIRRKQYGHTISGVFIFLLLGIFAISSTVMVLIGAQVYNASSQRTTAHNDERIAASYIRSKLREADEQGMLQIEGINASEASQTAITESSGISGMLQMINHEEETVTLLYVYDGMLYEWYTLASLARSAQLPSGAAESVCSLDEMQVTMDGSLITVHLRSGDEWTAVNYTLRTAEGTR